MLFKKSFFWVLFAAQVVTHGAEQSAIQSLTEGQATAFHVAVHWKDQLYRSVRKKTSRSKMATNLDVYTFNCDPGMPHEESKILRRSIGSLAGYYCPNKGYILVFPKRKVANGVASFALFKRHLGCMILSAVKADQKKVIIEGNDELLLGIRSQLRENSGHQKSISYRELTYLGESLTHPAKPGDFSHCGAAPATYHRPMELSPVTPTIDATVLPEPASAGTLTRRFRELSFAGAPGSTPMPGAREDLAAFCSGITRNFLPALTERDE